LGWVGRVGFLLLEAYMQGVLRYERPTRYIRAEAVKEVLVLGRIEQRLFAEVRQTKHAQEAANANGGSDIELFNDMIGKALETYESLRELIIPYLGSGKKDYQSMWEEHFGMKVGSPEYKRMLELHEASYAAHINAEQRSTT
jgi:hypothetical protein